MASRIPSTSPVFPKFPKLYTVLCGDWVAHHMGEERNESSIKKTAPKSSSANLTLYLTESWMSDLGILLWKTQVQRLFTLPPGDSKCQMNIDTTKAVGCSCDRHLMRHGSRLCAAVQISCLLFDLDSAFQLQSFPSAAACECSGSTWIRSVPVVRGSRHIVLLCAGSAASWSAAGSSRGGEGCSVVSQKEQRMPGLVFSYFRPWGLAVLKVYGSTLAASTALQRWPIQAEALKGTLTVQAETQIAHSKCYKSACSVIKL